MEIKKLTIDTQQIIELPSNPREHNTSEDSEREIQFVDPRERFVKRFQNRKFNNDGSLMPILRSSLLL
jgi:hypothetical protein